MAMVSNGSVLTRGVERSARCAHGPRPDAAPLGRHRFGRRAYYNTRRAQAAVVRPARKSSLDGLVATRRADLQRAVVARARRGLRSTACHRAEGAQSAGRVTSWRKLPA